MKQATFLLLALTFFTACSSLFNEQIDQSGAAIPNFNLAIPTAGNSWVLKNGAYIPSEIVTSKGIRNWSDPNQTIRTFFYLEKAGKISLGIRSSGTTGASKIKMAFAGESRTIQLEGNGRIDTYLGDFQVDKPGYHFIDISGTDKEGTVFADVESILLGVQDGATKYVKEDFYFGRRGPSVHLRFDIPEGVEQIEWFYSEITVPVKQDVMGSYFMANGFGEGYFGIQVNSETERRILFSIWSPYQTDNPGDVPEDYKIKLLKKGAGVTTGEFGNEGTGGQSYKVFNWKAGLTYGFLVGAKPTGDDHTDYAAYFYDPETDTWNLIAQFRRPKTDTYLTNLYSFLENFIPDQGVIDRKAQYGNQWVYDGSAWQELTSITFTADNTARKEYRLDYSGGVENNRFFLKNCGFSSDQVLMNSRFERRRLGQVPKIDFSSLPW